eukprot:c12446_g2_i8.p1 GENE.c12446_g2_i8~~c12446_g2_i8.p1  ORF type:complete len:195 (-),score=33.72 c12446_g2_i8:1221-1766(-)
MDTQQVWVLNQIRDYGWKYNDQRLLSAFRNITFVDPVEEQNIPCLCDSEIWIEKVFLAQFPPQDPPTQSPPSPDQLVLNSSDLNPSSPPVQIVVDPQDNDDDPQTPQNDITQDPIASFSSAQPTPALPTTPSTNFTDSDISESASPSRKLKFGSRRRHWTNAEVSAFFLCPTLQIKTILWV